MAPGEREQVMLGPELRAVHQGPTQASSARPEKWMGADRSKRNFGHSSVKLSKQVAQEENTDELVRFGRKLLRPPVLVYRNPSPISAPRESFNTTPKDSTL
ncbi:hypothetical protein R3I93_020149 [Phoxinus phoxinus]|uniref:Uncharacterized protein n=1 Tax=Phoxinus phoxinus TaxID=58324 RepID=A0AAN9CBG0_9TELE